MGGWVSGQVDGWFIDEENIRSGKTEEKATGGRGSRSVGWC